MKSYALAGVALAIAAGALAPSGAVPAPPVPSVGSATRAQCQPGSLAETALQGQVPKSDRDNGRSRLGYRCNLELIGQYQGQGASWASPSYGTCAYMPQAVPASLTGDAPGVRVVDASDPRHPRLATTLISPAMLGGPWESLKVNTRRGLLAGVTGGAFSGSVTGPAFFDVYDVATECATPRLLASVAASTLGIPGTVFGHEGGFSPDGRTYWASGGLPGTVAAIDIADPARPRVLAVEVRSTTNHGVSFSADGHTMYLSTIRPHGLMVFDVSDVQHRASHPQIRRVGSLTWTDGSTAQQTVPFVKGGRAYVITVDEMGTGAVRVLDVSEPSQIRLVSRIRLEIHLPEHAARRAEDIAGTGLFGYDAHYCSLDSPAEPTLLGCGFFNSGVRIFDVRDLTRPHEIAYYNPPARTGDEGTLSGSEHASGPASRGGAAVALTADWCSSPPRFVGRDQIWVTCQDNGFLALRLAR